jgi:hypothetical protein
MGEEIKFMCVQFSPEKAGYPQFRLSYPQVADRLVISTTFVYGLQ